MAKNKQATLPRLQRRNGLVACSVVGFALALAFLTRALDTGSYWQYLGGIVFGVLAAKLLIRAFK